MYFKTTMKSLLALMNSTMDTKLFSQKLTSWVCNDESCECGDLGQSYKIGRPAKTAWGKIMYPAVVAGNDTQIRPHGSDLIYEEFREADIGTLSTQTFCPAEIGSSSSQTFVFFVDAFCKLHYTL